MRQFCILPIGIPGLFSYEDTTLVCVLGNEVYAEHIYFWLP